jgi:rhodanese-related sulfurtransferase
VALQLAERGFYVKEMNAGWTEWTREGLPVEKGAAQAAPA